jgi:hypothetical protein
MGTPSVGADLHCLRVSDSMAQFHTAAGPARLKQYGEEWRYERDFLPLKIHTNFTHYIPCGIQLLQISKSAALRNLIQTDLINHTCSDDFSASNSV